MTNRAGPHRDRHLLGITGNIACGKSAVADALLRLGVETIDADLVYRDLVRPGMPLLDAIRRRFAAGVVSPDGGLDRRALGALVFADPAAMADLDALVRPVVGPEMLARARRSTATTVALDAVKLFESGLADACDETWAVVCPAPVQLDRLMRRNRLDREDALRRIAAQPPQATKAALADVVIDNGGSRHATERQVRDAFVRFLARFGRAGAAAGSAAAE